MDVPESSTHAFVIRLWSEEIDEEGRITWRGHITHALTGRQRPLQNVEDIVSFIGPYLQTNGGNE
jgi:hypothetical protein